MIVRRIPIQDLLAFLEEEGDMFNRYKNILDCISKHYNLLVGQKLQIRPQTALFDLCFCDSGAMTTNNFPLNADGILLLDKEGNFGITYHGYKLRSIECIETQDLWVWKLDKKGMLESVIFDENEWKCWGAMTGYYEYDNYEEGAHCLVGSRDLKIGMVGRDVFALQSYMALMGLKTCISGEFDQVTLSAVQTMQQMKSLVPSGVVKKEELIKLLVG